MADLWVPPPPPPLAGRLDRRKLAIVITCGDCPHYDGDHHDWSGVCAMLDRKVDDCLTGIPDECPLPDAPPE